MGPEELQARQEQLVQMEKMEHEELLDQQGLLVQLE